VPGRTQVLTLRRLPRLAMCVSAVATAAPPTHHTARPAAAKPSARKPDISVAIRNTIRDLQPGHVGRRRDVCARVQLGVQFPIGLGTSSSVISRARVFPEPGSGDRNAIRGVDSQASMRWV
jgi:hypothetical protein